MTTKTDDDPFRSHDCFITEQIKLFACFVKSYLKIKKQNRHVINKR